MASTLRVTLDAETTDKFIALAVPLLESTDSVTMTAHAGGVTLDIAVADAARLEALRAALRPLLGEPEAPELASFGDPVITALGTAIAARAANLQVRRVNQVMMRSECQDPGDENGGEDGGDDCGDGGGDDDDDWLDLDCPSSKIVASGEGVGSGDGPGPFTPGAPSADEAAKEAAILDALDKAAGALPGIRCHGTCSEVEGGKPCIAKWTVEFGEVIPGKKSRGKGYTTKAGGKIAGREHVEGTKVPWTLICSCACESRMSGHVGGLAKDLSDTFASCSKSWVYWGCAQVLKTVSAHGSYDHSEDAAAGDEAYQQALADIKETLAHRPRCPTACPHERVTITFWSVSVDTTESYDKNAWFLPYDVNIDARAPWQVTVKCLGLF